MKWLLTSPWIIITRALNYPMNLYQLSICCNILRSSLRTLIIYKTDLKKDALISERRDLCLPSGADRKQCCKLELQPHTHSSSAALRGHVISIRLINYYGAWAGTDVDVHRS